MPALPPMVAFVAPSGTGKTTLLEGVIRVLGGRGYRVGVLKHDAHRLELDKPGKDTWRFRRAGAWRAVIASDDQLGLFSAVEGPTTVGGLVDRWLVEADLVLCEGFRRSGLPLVRVHRAAVSDPAWRAPTEPVAWVSDAPVDTALPVLPLDDPEAVADFLVARFFPDRRRRRRATLVLPMRAERAPAEVQATAARLDGLCEQVLVVHAPGATPPDLPAVPDIKPGLGPLGGLLTALAASDTPHVLYLGERHHAAPRDLLERLLVEGSPTADVVAAVHGALREPLLACYGHRCLAAIQTALLSGEPRMDGWWGQVRVATVSLD